MLRNIEKFKNLAELDHVRELTAKNQRCTPKRSAALSVEMALCLPVLFAFLLGCYEIAHANMILHATESAAYEAARNGIIPGADQDRMRQAASGILNTVGVNDFHISISPAVITNQTSHVRVEIEVDYSRNTAAPKFFMRNTMLRGRCELSREIF